RVHNLGHPPRRLVGLMIDGSVHGLPEVGADIIVRPENDDEEAMTSARSIGTLKSVAMHHEMGAIGTAIIRRNTKPDVALIIRETPPENSEDDVKPSFTAAAQEILTSPDAGKVVGRVQGLTGLRRRYPKVTLVRKPDKRNPTSAAIFSPISSPTAITHWGISPSNIHSSAARANMNVP